MINWKVRLKNKWFWLALIPAALVFAQAAAGVFGFAPDFSALGDRLCALVEAAFTLLGILGIVADPTTEGLADSERAMAYTEPWKKRG